MIDIFRWVLYTSAYFDKLYVYINSFCFITYCMTFSTSDGYDIRFPTDFSAEGVLISNLLAGYEKRGGKYGRPLANHSHAVPVKLRLQLIQIIDLDEKNQVLKLNLWTNYVSFIFSHSH